MRGKIQQEGSAGPKEGRKGNPAGAGPCRKGGSEGIRRQGKVPCDLSSTQGLRDGMTRMEIAHIG